MGVMRVGLCGLGTVGQGILSVLATNSEVISRRAGRDVRITAVANRSAKPHLDLGDAAFGHDVTALVERPDVDVVVEVIGGEDTALGLIERALSLGKPVVTANKAVIARHGQRLLAMAAEHGTTLSFEAAVAGGLPVVEAVRQGLAANRIEWLAGIINGTSNYILSAMSTQGQEFTDALAVAQELGYAEADPTFDVEGIDAAQKLTILAAVGFDMPFSLDSVYTEGISHISREDIEYASALGYHIKHLGIARRTPEGVEARVHPTLIRSGELLAQVEGVMNAVLVHGDAAGSTLYYGAGAGALPTASAVIGDLIQIGRGAVAVLGDVSHTPVLPMAEVNTAYYLRIPVSDRLGVIARVAQILSESGISIEALIQREQRDQRIGEVPMVPVIILTDVVQERQMDRALREIEALPYIAGEIIRIRVESLAL